jgi:hypothetical protein
MHQCLMRSFTKEAESLLNKSPPLINKGDQSSACDAYRVRSVSIPYACLVTPALHHLGAPKGHSWRREGVSPAPW